MGKTKRCPAHLEGYTKARWIESKIKSDWNSSIIKSYLYVYNNISRISDEEYDEALNAARIVDDIRYEHYLKKHGAGLAHYEAVSRTGLSLYGLRSPQEIFEITKKTYPDFELFKPTQVPMYRFVDMDLSYEEFYEKSYSDYEKAWSVASKEHNKEARYDYFKDSYKKPQSRGRKRDKQILRKYLNGDISDFDLVFNSEHDGRMKIWDYY